VPARVLSVRADRLSRAPDRDARGSRAARHAPVAEASARRL